MAEALSQLERLLAKDFQSVEEFSLMQTPEINSTEFSAVKHPTREQWMEYLYGEMPRPAAAASDPPARVRRLPGAIRRFR